MTEPNKTTPSPQPVSTVTKHIKIYSDNKFHMAIANLIDTCQSLDSGKGITHEQYKQLEQTAEDILDITLNIGHQIHRAMMIEKHYDR